MHYTYAPRQGTRVSRTTARAQVRKHLGTASDGPPSTRRTLLAASIMAELVHLATDGRLKLVLLDDSNGIAVDYLTAIGAADTSVTS